MSTLGGWPMHDALAPLHGKLLPWTTCWNLLTRFHRLESRSSHFSREILGHNRSIISGCSQRPTGRSVTCGHVSSRFGFLLYWIGGYVLWIPLSFRKPWTSNRSFLKPQPVSSISTLNLIVLLVWAIIRSYARWFIESITFDPKEK